MNREEIKKDLMAQAEESIEKLMEWEGNQEGPTLAAIEAIVLEVGKEWERKLAQGMINRQETVRPVPGPACAQCGKEMRYKDKQTRQITSLVGELEVERSYYYCPRCRSGVFPPGPATSGVGQTLVGGDSQTGGLAERDDEQL